MRFDPQAGITHFVATAQSRRMQPRMRQETLHSSIGPVLDISAGGACILVPGALEGLIEFRIFDAVESVTVRAEVLRVRRVGLFKRAIGLRFVDLTSESSAVLARLATAHRNRRTM